MLVGRVRSAAARFANTAKNTSKARITAPAVFVPAAHSLSQLLMAQPVSTSCFTLQGAGSAGSPAEADPEDEEGSSGSTQKAADASSAGAAADSSGADVDVEALTKEVTELRGVRMRLLAEMENTRTIARRDVENAKTYAIQKFAKELLDVADNLERALGATPEHGLEEGSLVAQLHDGVSATERELLKLFEQQGIHKFGAPGDKFDPNKHDAMFQVPPGAGAEPGTVAQVLKKGFTFKDRVLRPAQVGAVSDE